MSGTPKFKIYRGKEYIGCTKYAEDAAALVALGGDCLIKYDHRTVVWKEGAEPFSAGESYDRAADWMHYRVQKQAVDYYMKTFGELPEGFAEPMPPDGYPADEHFGGE